MENASWIDGFSNAGITSTASVGTNVYDNVKHPLGYICKKIKYLTGNDNTQYTLTDLSMNNMDNDY